MLLVQVCPGDGSMAYLVTAIPYNNERACWLAELPNPVRRVRPNKDNPTSSVISSLPSIAQYVFRLLSIFHLDQALQAALDKRQVYLIPRFRKGKCSTTPYPCIKVSRHRIIIIVGSGFKSELGSDKKRLCFD